MATPRKDAPAEQRQRVLDYLNTHGETSARQLSAALQMSRSTLFNYLGPMQGDKEIETRHVPGATSYVTLYRAAVQVTKLRASAAPAVTHPLLEQFTILGRRVYYGTHRDHPHKNARGQGATYERRGIASSASWI